MTKPSLSSSKKKAFALDYSDRNASSVAVGVLASAVGPRVAHALRHWSSSLASTSTAGLAAAEGASWAYARC